MAVRALPDEPEGALSRRLNALVTGPVCADVAREVGVVPHLRLGKQAREDGAADSDNVLGDVIEALIGALYLEFGIEPARAFIRKTWASASICRARHPSIPSRRSRNGPPRTIAAARI
jgi:ribonuclease-3